MRCKLVRLIIKTIFGSRITVQSNFYPMRILGNVIVKVNYTIFSGSIDFPVTKECVYRLLTSSILKPLVLMKIV